MEQDSYVYRLQYKQTRTGPKWSVDIIRRPWPYHKGDQCKLIYSGLMSEDEIQYQFRALIRHGIPVIAKSGEVVIPKIRIFPNLWDRYNLVSFR